MDEIIYEAKTVATDSQLSIQVNESSDDLSVYMHNLDIMRKIAKKLVMKTFDEVWDDLCIGMSKHLAGTKRNS